MTSRFRLVAALALSLLANCPTAAANGVPISDAANNLAASMDFLAKNLSQPGVKATGSGLQYRVVNAGSGCSPSPDATVTLQYELRFAGDDKLIDSSYGLEEPISSTLKDMIVAWEEGIPLMREGAIWEFFVPPALGYGDKGSPPVIPPNTVLVFTIELIKSGTCAAA